MVSGSHQIVTVERLSARSWRGGWLSVGVYFYIYLVCVRVCVLARGNNVRRQTFSGGINDSACGSDFTPRDANSPRPADSTSDWLTAWLTRCLIDLTASCPSAVGLWERQGSLQTEGARQNVLVNKLWLTQCGATKHTDGNIDCRLVSAPIWALMSSLGSKCWRHPRCGSICTYWSLTAQRLFTKKSMHCLRAATINWLID